MQRFTVIIPAAGRSVRFGGPRNKLAEMLLGKTVFRRSLDAFLRRGDVAQVVVATTPGTSGESTTPEMATGDDLIDRRVIFTPGGSCRAQSVLRGLEAAATDIEWVAIHDAARPLVSDALIDQTLAAARQYGAAVPAMPVALTVKQAQGPLPARVERTLPRHTLWAMQTPQIMRRGALLAAYAACPLPLEQVTDDVQLLELAGQEVWLVAGEERNLKITTRSDLHLAEMVLRDAGEAGVG